MFLRNLATAAALHGNRTQYISWSLKDEERISRILRMQRQHREQLLHEMSPAAAAASAAAAAAAAPRRAPLEDCHRRDRHATPRTNGLTSLRARTSGGGSSVFDPFPDLLAHSDEGPSRSQTQCQLSDASEMLGAELTRSVMDPP
ncbi:hypothetical protein MTO96_010764 [Rhipicephalus appendiculatus]